MFIIALDALLVFVTIRLLAGAGTYSKTKFLTPFFVLASIGTAGAVLSVFIGPWSNAAHYLTQLADGTTQVSTTPLPASSDAVSQLRIGGAFEGLSVAEVALIMANRLLAGTSVAFIYLPLAALYLRLRHRARNRAFTPDRRSHTVTSR